jgi:hypothetical protein
MVREVTLVDISTMPDLIRLAEEVARTQQPHVLQRDNNDVAILIPARARGRRRVGRNISQADIDATLAAFGAWKGHIDPDEFMRQVKAGREDDRPPVHL